MDAKETTNGTEATPQNERVSRPVDADVRRTVVMIVAPCGHDISQCRNTGTPNWQNRFTCEVCGRNFSR